MLKVGSWAVLFALALVAIGCGGAPGRHLRFARASQAQIEEAQRSRQVVWYDFEAGDEVPLEFGLLGVSEAIADAPIRMVAQRPFSIVLFPDGRTAFSFDGRSLRAAQTTARWNIALGADENGGRATLVLFIGEEQDIPRELR